MIGGICKTTIVGCRSVMDRNMFWERERERGFMKSAPSLFFCTRLVHVLSLKMVYASNVQVIFHPFIILLIGKLFFG